MIIISGLGSSPISSWAYVMSLNTPWTVGTYTFLLNVILIVGQMLILHRHGLKDELLNIALQIPFSFLFGAFIDINMNLLRLGFTPENLSGLMGLGQTAYTLRMLCLLMGIAIQSGGLVLEVRPRVTMMSAEAFVYYTSRRWSREFGNVKVWFDCSLVTLAILCAAAFALCNHQSVIEAILVVAREGTLLAALLTGYLVRQISRHARPLDRFLFGTEADSYK